MRQLPHDGLARKGTIQRSDTVCKIIRFASAGGGLMPQDPARITELPN